MIPGWIVIVSYPKTDEEYYVCVDKDHAMAIAEWAWKDMEEAYEPAPEEIYTDYDDPDAIFFSMVEDGGYVLAKKQKILERSDSH